MQIIIKGKQMEITPRLRRFIEQKVKRLTRLVNADARVEVTVTEEQTRSANDRYSVQLALASTTYPVRSEVSAINANMALDLVLDKVVSQLGRQRGRETTTKRHNDQAGGKKIATSIDQEYNEQIWSKVVEIRRVPTKPMDDQEVIAQMETFGLSFLPFFNEATNSVNVMYRMDKGGYGLLMPELD